MLRAAASDAPTPSPPPVGALAAHTDPTLSWRESISGISTIQASDAAAAEGLSLPLPAAATAVVVMDLLVLPEAAAVQASLPDAQLDPLR